MIFNTAFSQTTKLFENPLKANSLTDLLLSILDAAITILIPIIILVIVYIGFKMIIAQTPEDIKSSKSHLLFSFLGLAIVLGAKGILSVVINSVNEFLAISSVLIYV